MTRGAGEPEGRESCGGAVESGAGSADATGGEAFATRASADATGEAAGGGAANSGHADNKDTGAASGCEAAESGGEAGCSCCASSDGDGYLVYEFVGPPDPRAYIDMSADQFAALMCAMHVCQGAGVHLAAFHMARIMYGMPGIRRRIAEVLVPQLAARSAAADAAGGGGSGAAGSAGDDVYGASWRVISSGELEAVWLEFLAIVLMKSIHALGIADVPAVAVQTCTLLEGVVQRLLDLDPKRPETHLYWMEAAPAWGDMELVYRAAVTAAQLGAEQGNHAAVLVGSFNAAYYLLGGLLPDARTGGRCPLGLLRSQAARGLAAEEWLRRWDMQYLVRAPYFHQVNTVKQAMKELAHLPDSAKIKLPYQPRGRVSTSTSSSAGSVRGPGSAAAAPSATDAAAGAMAGLTISGDSGGEGGNGGGRAAGGAAAHAVQQSAAAAASSVCDACGLPFFVVQKCSRCRQRKYCSPACQAEDWRAGHKAECKRMAQEAGLLK
ncbi:hypothetical protein HYH02_010825 [Chlamydomonas schloesseri]|uniref:MYND-type domain-containing protein n=1 Tax=Chlamydomonas schloesseri TaxID=2026947 RepID=A0A835W3W2_9CHLO|nr:hypothetical protein HYH02_010825 [Chlamydomonas schloesseri]|eukprot:KAG2438370.1 hypothetical protein HYH02_010825 [Chlamydomonas schloesseri]